MNKMPLKRAAVGALLVTFGVTIAAVRLRHGDPERDLYVAVGQLPSRPLEARLSGVPYAPAPSVKRRSSEAETLAELHAREAAREVIRSGSDSPLAVLVFSGSRAAQKRLERLTARKSPSAATWSDYAAVLHATAAPDDALQLASALAATDHALDIDPKLPEALFNRALVLEALALRGAAAKAYRKYLVEIDRSSPWSAEALDHLEKLTATQTRISLWRDGFRDLEKAAAAGDELFINDAAVAFPQETRAYAEEIFLARWADRVLRNDATGATSNLLLCRVIGRSLETHRGESLLADSVRAIEAMESPRELAKAHQAYARGRLLLARREIDQGIQAVEEAARLLERHRSPMALVARFQLMDLDRDSSDLHRALLDLRALDRQVPERYRALRAQIEMLRATVAAADGARHDAVESYRAASRTFAALGEERNAVRTTDAAATLMTTFGETTDAWRSRHASLSSSADAGDDRELVITARAAAIDALVDERWDLAHALLNAVVDTPGGNDDLKQEAMVWRVVAAKRAHMDRTAAADLREARKAVAAPPERPDVSGADRLRIVEALVAEDRRHAVPLLTQSIQAAELNGRLDTVAQLLIERASAFRAIGKAVPAQRDLEHALKLVDENRTRFALKSVSDVTLRNPTDVYRLLADTEDAQGHSLRAVDILEQRRTSPDGDLGGGISTAIPEDTTLVVYGVFDARLVIYAIDSGTLTRVEVPITARRLERLVAALDEALLRRDEAASYKAVDALSRILINPISRTIAARKSVVFAFNEELQPTPFGALLQGDGRFLVVGHRITIAPSASSYLRSLHAVPKRSRALLSVGNPFSASGESSPLDGAEAEATEIAAMYPSRAMLLGTAATKQRVVSALAYCDAAHFAVHASAGAGEASGPYLRLAASRDDDGKLSASEIAPLHLAGIRTVVLAACGTAVPVPGHSVTRSLVNAFLAAGAGSVVGTLWDVEDEPTRRMSVELHRALRDGATPAEALRQAQITMIRSGAPLRDWASLQLYGSGL
jgi:CHAT domain-containing protein